MLTFDEALAQVLHGLPSVRTEVVALQDAFGRVLAETVCAPGALPPFDYSAMDGYAMDTQSMAGEPPWELAVEGESKTGRGAPRLVAGAACRVFTGAPIPEGADTVVMQENVTREGDTIRVGMRPRSGDHIRKRGEDVASGAPVLAAGTRLGAYQLGLVAAVDRAELRVSVRPRVTILATGDELRKPGSAPREATIPESNSIVVWALATAAGAAATVAAASSDDLDETRRTIEAALRMSDLVVTIGGVSVGDYDVVRPALEAAGVELGFHKVAIKPGKPLTLGRKGDVRVLGLPGNPMSAQVTFALFGVPLLRRLQGEERVAPSSVRCRLSAPMRQKPGRRGYYPALISGGIATPLSGQSSGSTVSLALAQGLVILPAESAGYDANEVVDVFMLGKA